MSIQDAQTNPQPSAPPDPQIDLWNAAKQPLGSRLGWAETFGYALAGIRYAWRSQRNFRVESIAALFALALALLLRVPATPILLCCLAVLSLEMVNTAIEAVVDLASPIYHPLAKIAKDVAAGAVLLASGISVVVGLLEFAPVVLRLLGW